MNADDKEMAWIDHKAITKYVNENEPMRDFYLDDLSTRDASRAQKSRDGEHRHKKLEREYIADEDVQNATHYWDHWSKQDAYGLPQKYDTDIAHKQLIYSGKCGPPLRYRHLSSAGSDSTNLSLLSASDLEPQLDPRPRSLRKKKKTGKLETKTDWEQYAMERHGALAQMMQQDASRMEGHGVSKPTRQDAMTREERSLLVKCGKTKNKLGRSRSFSTPQVFITAREPKSEKMMHKQNKKKHVLEQGSANKSTRPVFDDNASTVYEPVANYKSRTPSPKVIAFHYNKKTKRPLSMPERKAMLPVVSPVSRANNFHLLPSPFSHEMVPPRVDSTTFTMAQSKQQDNLREMLGGNAGFTQNARKKINKTFRMLDERTGYGDPRNVIASIPEEMKMYTSAEYGRVHRYPQNIRIAPQLTRVIKEDICSRMGRPKRHEIKTYDVKRFNKDQPELGRQHRNLVIFNWLNALNEDDFDSKSEPDIFDIEGDDLGNVGNRLGTGMVGQHFHGTETNSDGMSPRVSDEERWGDDSREWGSDIIVVHPLDDSY